MRPSLIAILLLALAGPAAAGPAGETFRLDRASLAPFPRTIGAGATLTFAVTLRPRFTAPVFSQTLPSGETRYLRPARVLASNRAEFDAAFDAGPGAYRMELVVDSPDGDCTAAQFTIYSGVEPPPEGETESRRGEDAYPPERADEDPVRLERDLFRMVNAYRTERRLPPYPWLEPAAILARDHLRDYLALKPRPATFPHVIPGKGSIADRFVSVLAWPTTVRKFPVEDPEIGPEAVSYCSESLAAPKSLAWLFREYFLQESAFRAPMVSPYPTHAAVGMVRDGGRLYTATVMVQVNSTRVRAALEDEWKNATRLEEEAEEGADRAEFLRRLGRISDPRSRKLFERRLAARDPEVRAGALDALLLADPAAAEEHAEKQWLAVARAHDRDRYGAALPVLRAFERVRYDAATRVRARAELAALDRLSRALLSDAMATEDAAERRATLALVVERFAGLPAADEAAKALAGGDASGPPRR